MNAASARLAVRRRRAASTQEGAAHLRILLAALFCALMIPIASPLGVQAFAAIVVNTAGMLHTSALQSGAKVLNSCRKFTMK